MEHSLLGTGRDLALGVTAAGIGRPCGYGLALGGAPGIWHVLRRLLAGPA